MKSREHVSTKMEQIAENARKYPEGSFTSLAYHIDLAWLYEAYRNVRKDGATGVDDQTANDFAIELKENLESLLDRFKSGRYRAQPVKRVYIPKPGKKETRPLGIPTFEDKVLQQAVVWTMMPIYEGDFLDCSFGFRPKRSQHQALKTLWGELMKMGGAWIIDLDIRKYFDSIQWTQLRDVIKRRVCDGVLLRTIGKWMNAGIMEAGQLHYPETGTPQGAVISPLLSNIFLHEVLDKWLHEEAFPRLKGKAFEIRFADDAIICFEHKEDAERVLRVLPKRLEKYGLTMHPEKTRLVNFKKPYGEYGRTGRPDTFDFLGFTHYWKKSRKGKPYIARKTAKDRLSRALVKIKEWCKKNRHLPLGQQHIELSRKIKGHYGYYGIIGNFKCLSNFLSNVTRIWRKWLERRSRNRDLFWRKMQNILERFNLPRPRIVHSDV